MEIKYNFFRILYILSLLNLTFSSYNSRKNDQIEKKNLQDWKHNHRIVHHSKLPVFCRLNENKERDLKNSSNYVNDDKRNTSTQENPNELPSLDKKAGKKLKPNTLHGLKNKITKETNSQIISLLREIDYPDIKKIEVHLRLILNNFKFVRSFSNVSDNLKQSFVKHIVADSIFIVEIQEFMLKKKCSTDKQMIRILEDLNSMIELYEFEIHEISCL